ncbi:MAG: hypothetical protein EBU84_17940 [Actinobacteria bacterium]|nr:hypothetical protein [Actinomycetota bacterium]
MAAVVRKIAAAPYAQQFRDEFGANILRTPDAAFAKVGEAIAAFERTPALQAFSSKYDQVIQGRAQFSAREANGMKVFMDPNKGNCASCHLMNPKFLRQMHHLQHVFLRKLLPGRNRSNSSSKARSHQTKRVRQLGCHPDSELLHLLVHGNRHARTWRP